MRRWLLLLVLCLLPFAVGAAEVAVPQLAAHVTDLTGTLTPEQRAALESKLQAFEAQKGSQIAVLIVPTTQPEAIEQYSMRVAEQWKLGRQKVDDGVLLLVAKNDRKMRIEVGYGLEGALPDVIAKRIVADDIAPHFKQGDFYGGVNAGVTRIISVIQGEALPAPQPPARRSGNGAAVLENYFPFLLFGALVAGALLRNVLGAFPGALVNGGLVGAAVMLLGGGLVFAALLGVMAFVFALGGVSFWGGGFGGGGYRGDFGGGGGFSGGGGGFGGGGASGNW